VSEDTSCPQCILQNSMMHSFENYVKPEVNLCTHLTSGILHR
jgi:hypothetical protein